MVAAEGVVVPYTDGLGHGSAAGVLLASAAGGMLAGEFLVGRFLAPRVRERATPWLALLLGVPLLGFVLRPGVLPAALLLAVAAAGSPTTWGWRGGSWRRRRRRTVGRRSGWPPPAR
jgi:hypothetical protein